MEHSAVSFADLFQDAEKLPSQAAEPNLAVVEPEQPVDKTYELKELENKILQKNLTILDDVARFADVAPGTEKPPQEWVDELGAAGAERRLRIVNAAWMSAKEAPVALSIAKSTVTGIAKARANERPMAALQVNIINFPAPVASTAIYGAIEVHSDD